MRNLKNIDFVEKIAIFFKRFLYRLGNRNYKVLLKKSKHREEQFENAFQDIYALANKMCTSKNDLVKAYIAVNEFLCEDFAICSEEKTWLSCTTHSVTIGSVVIGKDDALTEGALMYDFGAWSENNPADSNFLAAILCIFYHHISNTKFPRDPVRKPICLSFAPRSSVSSPVDTAHSHFDNGVLLARLVNSEIQNPYDGKSYHCPTKYLLASGFVQELYDSLISE